MPRERLGDSLFEFRKLQQQPSIAQIIDISLERGKGLAQIIDKVMSILKPDRQPQ